MRWPSPFLVVAAVVLAAAAGAQPWKGRARLDGLVTNADGVPLLGATVSLERLSGERGPRVVSDAKGLWTVDGIAPGSWMVAVEAPGYGAERVGVHLPSESSWLAPLEVRLDEERPAPRTEALTADRSVPEGGTGPPAVPAEVRAALAAGRTDRARKLVSSLDGSDPAAPAILVEVGVALLTAGETTDAVACFDEALERDPTRVEARYRRALGLLALGRHTEARRDFEEVAASAPEGSSLASQARLALDELTGAGR